MDVRRHAADSGRTARVSTASPALNAKTVVYDGVYTLAGRILKTLLALVLSILVARVLGPHDRGIYALATGVYAGLVLSVFIGISSAVSYFMLNTAAGRGILRPALLTGVIFSLAGSLPILAMTQIAHNAWAALPSIALLPCNVPLMLILGYALGTKRIRWQTSYSVVSTGVLLAGMGLTFALFSRGALAAVTAYVAVSALLAAGCLTLVLIDARSLPYRAVALRDFFFFATRAGAVNFVSLLNYRADLYVVGLLATPTVLGQYAVAIAAAESLLVVTQVAAVATSPHVGSMERGAAARLTARCVRATLVVALATCVLFYAIAPYAVGLLYGAAYLPMVPALRILLIAVFILSVGSALSNFFTLKLGKPEVALVSASCAAAACVAVSWVLVPRIGMVGAASATAAAYLIGQAIQIAYFVKTSKLHVTSLLVPTADDVRCVIAIAKGTRGDLRRVMDRFAAPLHR